MKLKARCEEGMLVRCNVDGHEYVLDHAMPDDPDRELKGTIPGRALMVALAGCKAMVVRSFLLARKIDAPVDVEITMDGDKDSGKFISHSKVKIHIDADLSEKDRGLIEKFVDDQCAIEQVITGSENTVETEYTFG